jgi:hypothetical protein
MAVLADARGRCRVGRCFNFPYRFSSFGGTHTDGKKPFLFLNAAPRGRAVEIAFFYSREPATTLEPKFLQFGIPWFRTDLDNGDMVWMVGREADFDATVLPPAETLKSISGRLLAPGASAKGRNLTVNLWNSPKDNEPLILIEIGGISASADVITFLSSLFQTSHRSGAGSFSHSSSTKNPFLP